MRKAVLSLVGLLCLAMSGNAAEAEGRPMDLSGSTSQPIGHYDFCKRHPKECRPNDTVSLIRFDAKSWGKIKEVNTAVNAAIFPRTDEELYGVAEYWEYPTTEGDCEEFVLLKQYMLERAGFPRSALLVTVARQPNGDGHAVLTVRTDRGDYVLDNLEDRVLDWKMTGLKFLKRQSEKNAGKWMGIDDARDVLVGSVR